MEKIILNNGVEMPALGFGVFKMKMPRSVSSVYMMSFRLSDDDMQAIAELDKMQKIADINSPELVKALHSLKIHD